VESYDEALLLVEELVEEQMFSSDPRNVPSLREPTAAL